MTIATLLPNAEQTFTNANGAPLAGGKVYFYVPNTSTPKSTWQDANGAVLNTNPIILNAAGRAIIYGTGNYRQVVQDASGNTIWDQLTQDITQVLQSSVSIWCGTSAGSPNAQTVTPESPIASYVVGQGYTFQAGFTNTGPTTLNISEVGPINITQSGSALSANTIQINSINLVVYDGTNLQLLGSSFTLNTSITGSVLLFTAIAPPIGYLECNGSAISRTTYSTLFSVIGTVFGSGDGTTTFNIPDFRGYFARGWDDGAGIDPGRAFGSIQQDAIESFTATSVVTDPGHAHSYVQVEAGGTLSGGSGGGTVSGITGTQVTGITVATTYTGETETRPKNLALMYIIKT